MVSRKASLRRICCPIKTVNVEKTNRIAGPISRNALSHRRLFPLRRAVSGWLFFAGGEKSFCCFGCQTVFSLLRENGLEQFYQLQSAPGTRIRGRVRRRQMGVPRRPGGGGKTSGLRRQNAGQSHAASAGHPLRRVRLAAGKSVQAASGHRPFAGEFFAPRSRHHLRAGQNQIQRTCRAARVHRLRTGTDVRRNGEKPSRRRGAKKRGCKSASPASRSATSC